MKFSRLTPLFLGISLVALLLFINYYEQSTKKRPHTVSPFGRSTTGSHVPMPPLRARIPVPSPPKTRPVVRVPITASYPSDA
ncbi:MAG TPA: hypothetical protein PKO06_14435, partial [Candidatus Ozemobacteraceae bacterium]|nr:hypothetical protein [Candidatus Ozemobacteraceae bacterium]